MFDTVVWPPWTFRLAWTIATLGLAWLTGHVLALALKTRGVGGSAATSPRALAPSTQVIARRLPWWGLLLGMWLSLAHWPLTAATHAAGSSAVFAVAVLSVSLAMASIASQVLSVYGTRLAPGLPVSSLTQNIAWGLVVALGVLVVLSGLGISITPMLTALGVGGLAVALALQEPLSNFFAGVFLALAGQIRVGDYVKLDSGHEGHVSDFGWRSTRLRMLANNLVVVPNAKLAQALVVNHHLPSPDLAVLVEVGVDYASDLEHVERVVGEVGADVMATVTGGVAGFQPFVRFHSFGASSIDFTAILRAREYVDQYAVKHEFIKRLHRRFDREGIVIPFPIRTLISRP